MTSGPPLLQAGTLKQARAAYKKRQNGYLSDAERKKLERSIELDRRAERAREAEKRRAEAAKKRSEKEKEERTKVQLGSQRRCDRFGYKSSQMHLGAFLGRPAVVSEAQEQEGGGDAGKALEEDEFGCDEMDDAAFLEVSEANTVQPARSRSSIGEPAQSRQSPTRGLTSQRDALGTTNKDDFSFPFHEFGSSTQIAREIASPEPTQTAPRETTPITAAFSAYDSFGDDFDLSMEDLEELDKSLASKKAFEDRKIMPPPPLPAKKTIPPTTISAITVSELESFIDDDLQLTQVDPG